MTLDAKPQLPQQLVRADQPFEPRTLDEGFRLAKALASAEILPEALRGKPGDVLATVMAGRELGLSPMQSIRGVHIIKGKPVLSADLMVALCKRHPECVYFRLVESSAQRAIYETERRGEGVTKMAFTLEEAKAAGLLGKEGGNWTKYPAAMCRARAAAALARVVYSDALFGVYVEGELDDEAHRRGRSNVVQVVADVPTAEEEVGQTRQSTISAREPGDDQEEAPEDEKRARALAWIAEAPHLGALETLKKALKDLGLSDRDRVEVFAEYSRRETELRA